MDKAVRAAKRLVLRALQDEEAGLLRGGENAGNLAQLTVIRCHMAKLLHELEPHSR